MKALVFDRDGTVVDTVYAHPFAWQQALTEADSIQQRHGELFREVLPDPRPLPGARELVAFVRQEGLPNGIATSGRRSRTTHRSDPARLPPWRSR